MNKDREWLLIWTINDEVMDSVYIPRKTKMVQALHNKVAGLYDTARWNSALVVKYLEDGNEVKGGDA